MLRFFFEIFLVRLIGLEPMAYCLEGSYSIQLSYSGIVYMVSLKGFEPLHLSIMDFESILSTNSNTVTFKVM